MLSTAIAIQQATQESVHHPEVMSVASALFHKRNELAEDDFVKELYFYSAHLSAVTATLVTQAILTESQMDEMIDSIKEMETLGEEITNGNN